MKPKHEEPLEEDEEHDITWLVESIADDVAGLACEPPEGMELVDGCALHGLLHFDITDIHRSFTGRVISRSGEGGEVTVTFDEALARATVEREGRSPLNVDSHHHDVAWAILFGVPYDPKPRRHRRRSSA